MHQDKVCAWKLIQIESLENPVEFRITKSTIYSLSLSLPPLIPSLEYILKHMCKYQSSNPFL